MHRTKLFSVSAIVLVVALLISLFVTARRLRRLQCLELGTRIVWHVESVKHRTGCYPDTLNRDDGELFPDKSDNTEVYYSVINDEHFYLSVKRKPFRWDYDSQTREWYAHGESSD